MKSAGLGFVYLTLLMLLIACGKDNESGKSSSYSIPYTDGYGIPPVGVNSPYAYSGISVNQVITENPCVSGYGGYTGTGMGTYAGQRVTIQIPLTSFPTVIPPNDVYVGITSYGDVATIVGMPSGQPPLFVGYLCPRSFAANGQGQLMGVTLGSYSNCLFKPLTAANIVFPGGAAANFRMLDFRSSAGQHFSFCR